MKLTVQCVVKNEDKWIWFALNSVLPIADEILIADTGSSDRTVEIIKTISSSKIKLFRFPASTPSQVTAVRQSLLSKARGDWLLILDGDEIWPAWSLSESLRSLMTHPDSLFLVNTFVNLLGDVYHFQEDLAGHYQVGPFRGHVTIRFINLKLSSGLQYRNNYPLEGLYTIDGRLLQDLAGPQTPLIRAPYLHATHLRRTSGSEWGTTFNRKHKYKYEWGCSLPKNFAYPVSFYLPRPLQVPTPWRPARLKYKLVSVSQSPLLWLKRRIFV